MKLIIGITTRFGSGATSTKKLLKIWKGFKEYSLSEELKNTAKKTYPDFETKSENIKRKILQDIGDEKRKHNPRVLANNIIRKIKRSKNKYFVVDCIKNPAEIQAFRETFNNFFLLAIDAQTETRWQRLKDVYKNNRVQFDIDDERDAGDNEQPYGQKVKECMELADILINCDENFFDSQKKLNKNAVFNYYTNLAYYIDMMENPGILKPRLDELYMNYAYSASLMSMCHKRRVGAVIVHEKYEFIKKKKFIRESYVIATGHNNTPKLVQPCDKCYRDKIREDYSKDMHYCRNCGHKLDNTDKICTSCEFNNLTFPSKLLDLCQSVHAEEAAILQSARIGGIPLENAKLYTTTLPCLLCAKKIIFSGIKEVVYLESYPVKESLEMLREAGIIVNKFEGVNARAFYRLFKE